MRLTKYKNISGLSLELKLGDVISINNGEIVIQLSETMRTRGRIIIQADREKYVVKRCKIMHKAGPAKPEEVQ